MLSDMLMNCPESFPVFQQIGMHCMGCAMASAETIEEACAVHGVDPDEFIAYLKAYLQTL